MLQLGWLQAGGPAFAGADLRIADAPPFRGAFECTREGPAVGTRQAGFGVQLDLAGVCGIVWRHQHRGHEVQEGGIRRSRVWGRWLEQGPATAFRA